MKKLILIIILGITLFTGNRAYASDFLSDMEWSADGSSIDLGSIPSASLNTPSNSVSFEIFTGTYPDESSVAFPHTNICCGGASMQNFADNAVPFSSFGLSDGTYWIKFALSSNTSFSGATDIYYYNFTVSGGDPVPPENNIRTRFISVTPLVESTVSTTTTIGAEIYINPVDYVDGMYLSMSFTNQTLTLTGGSALDAFNSATGQGEDIKIPLSSGLNNVSTTTTFLFAGKTQGTYTVKSDGFLSSLPLIGFFFSTNNLIASSTYFYVGYKSGLDIAVELGGASVAQYILTGTTTGANTILNCSNLLSGGITPCIVSLIIPNGVTFSNDLTRLRNGFLSVWPLGYVTRFIEITASTGTSSLPTISYTTATSSMFGIATFAFDPFGTLNASSSPINYVSDTNGNPKTIWEIMEYPTYVVVYLMLLFMIIHDITGISKHKRK